MTAKASDDALADAIIQNVEHGTYPESEEVISAELPTSAYPKLLESIEKARDEVKDEVRALSRNAAPDVDTWIAQARQLQADLERSKVTAHEIVQQAEAGKELRATAEDAANKVRLLQSELAFTVSLADTLNQVKSISTQLDEVQGAVAEERLVDAIDGLENVVDVAKELSSHETSRFTALLHDRIARLGAEVRELAVACWDRIVIIDTASKQITVRTAPHEGPTRDLRLVTDAVARLHTLDDILERFWNNIEATVVGPCLLAAPAAHCAEIRVDGDTLRTVAANKSRHVADALDDAQRLLDFLYAKLPKDFGFELSQKLVPVVSSRLIDEWLLPAVPLSVQGIDEFQELLDRIQKFSEHLRSFEWFGANILSEWVDEAPRIWLSRRKEVALASIRASSFKNLGSRKVVERVETQMVSHEDDLAKQMAEAETDENWGDDWSDEGKEPSSSAAGDEDEDASAWDIDDDTTNDTPRSPDRPSETAQADGESGDAWGWGEGEEDVDQRSPSKTSGAASSPPKTNGAGAKQRSAEREVTLSERYTITGIPDSLMELIHSIISDAETLSNAKFASSPIAPAARGLYAIPPLVLSMYRATAATFYAKDDAGNMLMYNDCSRLSEQLSKLAADSASSGVGRLRLDSDIKLLDRFGKRAYGREMEIQRTILRDRLDGAQSFTNCTVQPFAMECENAVDMTADRVREVKMQWEGILSPSALLQSLGNLLSTVTSKFILDIEEMSDISEDQSVQLRKLMDKIAALADLFAQTSPDGRGEQVVMVGVYTPNWFKFQYLGEILDSRLADIIYLWQEGELSLEFEVGEVVDLIEALFADSDYRRNAIRDIRASTGHR